MNKQEYERWEAPAPKKPKKGKWFLLGLLVLFVLYFVSGIKVSHHDSNEDKIEIEDQVLSDEVENNEGFSFQSTLDNQEELNNKTKHYYLYLVENKNLQNNLSKNIKHISFYLKGRKQYLLLYFHIFW